MTKKILPILPKRYPTQNCLENCIANYCDAINEDFRAMFLFSWSFGYHVLKVKEGERLDYPHSFNLDYDGYILLYEKLYPNISLKSVDIDVKTLYQKCLEGAVFAIGIDSFDCHWNLAYHKYHYQHYYLLTINIDKPENFIAIDSFSTLEVIDFDKNILNYSKKCYIIEQTQVEVNKDILRKKIIKEFYEVLLSTEKKELSDSINKFKYELQNIKSIDNLFPITSDASNTFLIIRLSYISNSRYNTKLFFEYINLDNSYIESIQNIYERWEILKNIFIKIFISRNVKLLIQVSSELTNILNLEKKLCEDIIKLLDNKFENCN